MIDHQVAKSFYEFHGYFEHKTGNNFAAKIKAETPLRDVEFRGRLSRPENKETLELMALKQL